MTIRYYRKKGTYGVILPRAGGIKFFKEEEAAKQFMLACGLFEDVWPPDEPQAAEAEEPTVTPTSEDEVAEEATEEQTETHGEDD